MERPAPSEPVGREVTPLPSIDRGRQAWSFVAAGFAIETLLWGGLFSTGVFLKYYAAHEVGHYMVSGEACIVKLICMDHFSVTQPFSRSSETKISLIGTVSLLIGCKSSRESRKHNKLL
jgi:hypothetical protein